MAKSPAAKPADLPPLDPNLPADAADAPDAVAEAPPQPIPVPLDPLAMASAQALAIPKPAHTIPLELPMDPSGYIVTRPRGMFALIRVKLRDIWGNIRDLCLPMTMKQVENWPVERAGADASGPALESPISAQEEHYSEQERDLILSLQRRPLWSPLLIRNQPQAGASYGFGGFDPLAAGDRVAGAMPSGARERLVHV